MKKTLLRAVLISPFRFRLSFANCSMKSSRSPTTARLEVEVQQPGGSKQLALASL